MGTREIVLCRGKELVQKAGGNQTSVREAATQATKLLTLMQLQSHGWSRGEGQAGAGQGKGSLASLFSKEALRRAKASEQWDVLMSWEEYATGWLKCLFFHLCMLSFWGWMRLGTLVWP